MKQFKDLRYGFYPPHTYNETLPLVTLTQKHTADVHIITTPLLHHPEGDGLVTNVPGIALGIWTADCGPLLFYDPEARVIGACHAGWRGAKGGIIQQTVKTMETIGAQRTRIHALLGPTIQVTHYEIGPEFHAFFEPRYFRKNYFDLPLYIMDLLYKEGIANAQDEGINTFIPPWGSRRRQLQAGKKMYDDNLSVIAMV